MTIHRLANMKIGKKLALGGHGLQHLTAGLTLSGAGPVSISQTNAGSTGHSERPPSWTLAKCRIDATLSESLRHEQPDQFPDMVGQRSKSKC